jgi:hypothetical protein
MNWSSARLTSSAWVQMIACGPPADADPVTGRRRWTDRQFLYAHCEDAELGYAVTGHTAQGRTVRTGLAVIAGTEDRQHAYVALTRGTDVNTAYVFTASPKRADPVPGPRPAPELARYDRRATGPGHQPPPAATTPGQALAVLVLPGAEDADVGGIRDADVVTRKGPAAGVTAGLWW